ncbi:MAG TPA: hypothetical protein VGR14_15070 [Verrucomicrobiae bacterium]|jgi:hypothetical protein|nr:hypothetical protein [Verrucomicrobiae bacterium]
MSDFEVKISTPVELSGAAQAAAELDKVKDSAEKAGRAAHEAGISHKELHESIKLAALSAGDAIGPIGELGHFLGSPELLGVAGAVLAFKMLIEQMNASREAALKQLEAFTAFHDFLASNHQRAMLESAAQTHTWNLQLEHARDNVDQLTQALQRSIAAGQESLHNTNDLISAQERLAEAIIHAREAAGQITPAAASEQERQAQLAARHAREAAEDQQAQADIAAKRGRAEAAGGEISDATGRVAGLRGDARDNNEAIGLADNRIEELRKASEEATKAAEEAKVKIGKHEAGTQAGADLRAKEAAAEQAKGMLETAIKHKADLEEQGETIKEDIQSQRALITSRNELRDKLNEEADAAEQSLHSRQAGRAQVEAVDNQTDAVNRRAANEDMVRRVQSGRGTAAEGQQVAAWRDQAQSATESGPEGAGDASHALEQGQSILSIIQGQGGRGNAQQMAQVHGILERVIALLGNHSGYVQQYGPNLAELEARLSNLESRMGQSQQGF